MRIAALISQPLRANYCKAYVDRCDGAVILTSDPSAFDDLDLGLETHVLAVSPLPELVPSKRLTRSRLFRTVVERARRGSRVGRWAEMTAKRFAWRLRYVDRALLLARRRRQAPSDPESLRSSAIYQALLGEAANDGFQQLVVFDVFDLPIALQFGDDNGMDVLVR
jgi:hypothetical protein